MKLFYAHYPSLENAFVRYVRSERTDALAPWLVICSSGLVVNQLKNRLAREFGAAANIHFITGGALVSILDSEAPGATLPLLPQDNLRDFLIKNLLQEPDLNHYPASRGFVQAVKSSLRDLEDSLVGPDVIDKYVRTASDTALEADKERLIWLNRLYRRYLQAQQNVPGYRPYQAAFERALAQVEKSAFLKGFKQIVFYGFYDMPGRQLELVNRLRGHYPVAVFAPYMIHPAYHFAQKFFEANWFSAGGENAETDDFGALGSAAKSVFSAGEGVNAPGVQIISAGDASGELFFTAKEILRLVEKEGYSFADIAVIARTVTPYQDELRRVFKQNCIPLNASFSYPVTHYPLGVFCLNLFALAQNGFERNLVLSVVSSPYFKHASKNKWRALISRSLVNRDFSQWQDLLPQTKNYDPEFLSWLTQIKNRLEQLGRSAEWGVLSQEALALLRELTDEENFEGKEAEIYRAVCERIQSLASYSVLRSQAQDGEFLEELADAVRGLSFNEAETVRGGVVFTDAVRARGLSFKAVFLLGLNDKVFPLLMPEDPVLRDYYRYVLRDVLGYWINQSLDRGDEEKLFFFAAATSAREKLYALYARRGSDGKEVSPSVYLAELARATLINWQADGALRVSGRFSEKLSAVAEDFLTPKELSYTFIFSPENAAKKYALAQLLTPGIEDALAAAGELAKNGPLNAYDGVISSGAEIFAQEDKLGFSPSTLQKLGQCPMRIFFEKGLKLRQDDDPLSRQELPPNLRGTVYHEILKDFYEDLFKRGLTHDLFDEAALEYLNQAVEKHYRADSYRQFGIYPVVWELLLQNIKELLGAFVLDDLHDQGDFVPAKFEIPVSLEPSEKLPLRLRGIIDRVDIDEKHKLFRIDDYKSSRKGTKDLAADIFKHLIFQPFVYVLIARQLPELKDYESAGSCLLAIAPKYHRSDLLPTAFEDVLPRACQFLVLLTDYVKNGVFFINPDDKKCQYCPYAAACRRDSFKSLLRARKSAAYKSLQEAVK